MSGSSRLAKSASSIADSLHHLVELHRQRLDFDRQIRTLDALERFNQQKILEFRVRLREYMDGVEPVEPMPAISEAERIRRITESPEGRPDLPSLAEMATPILGMLEDLSIAVQVGCLDERILQGALALIICDVFEGLKPYIDYRRRLVRLGDPSALYRETEWLYERWKLPRTVAK